MDQPGYSLLLATEISEEGRRAEIATWISDRCGVPRDSLVVALAAAPVVISIGQDRAAAMDAIAWLREQEIDARLLRTRVQTGSNLAVGSEGGSPGSPSGEAGTGMMRLRRRKVAVTGSPEAVTTNTTAAVDPPVGASPRTSVDDFEIDDADDFGGFLRDAFVETGAYKAVPSAWTGDEEVERTLLGGPAGAVPVAAAGTRLGGIVHTGPQRAVETAATGTVGVVDDDTTAPPNPAADEARQAALADLEASQTLSPKPGAMLEDDYVQVDYGAAFGGSFDPSTGSVVPHARARGGASQGPFRSAEPSGSQVATPSGPHVSVSSSPRGTSTPSGPHRSVSTGPHPVAPTGTGGGTPSGSHRSVPVPTSPRSSVPTGPRSSVPTSPRSSVPTGLRGWTPPGDGDGGGDVPGRAPHERKTAPVPAVVAPIELESATESVLSIQPAPEPEVASPASPSASSVPDAGDFFASFGDVSLPDASTPGKRDASDGGGRDSERAASLEEELSALIDLREFDGPSTASSPMSEAPGAGRVTGPILVGPTGGASTGGAAATSRLSAVLPAPRRRTSTGIVSFALVGLAIAGAIWLYASYRESRSPAAQFRRAIGHVEVADVSGGIKWARVCTLEAIDGARLCRWGPEFFQKLAPRIRQEDARKFSEVCIGTLVDDGAKLSETVRCTIEGGTGGERLTASWTRSRVCQESLDRLAERGTTICNEYAEGEVVGATGRQGEYRSRGTSTWRFERVVSLDVFGALLESREYLVRESEQADQQVWRSDSVGSDARRTVVAGRTMADVTWLSRPGQKIGTPTVWIP